MEINLEDLSAEILDSSTILQQAAKSTRGVGKTKVPLTASVTKELTAKDVKEVGVAQVGVHTTPPLKKLRESHHKLARLLAQGYTPHECHLLTGFCKSRISILQADPSFIDLVAYYRDLVQDIFVDTVDRMKQLTDDAIGILQERIVEDPDSISDSLALEIITKIGDRAGFSPVSKSAVVHLPVDEFALSQIKSKVRDRESGKVKEITKTENCVEYKISETVSREPERVSSGEGSLVGAQVRTAPAVQREEKTQRFPRQGNVIREASWEETEKPV